MKKTATIKLTSLIFASLAVFALLSISIPIPGKWAKKFATAELTKIIPGKWQVNSVSISVINGLCIGDVVGKPQLPVSSQIEVTVPKILISLNLPALLKKGKKIVPIRELKVRDALIQFDAGFPHPVVMKLGELNIKHKQNGAVEGKITLEELKFGKTVCCNDFNGLFGGNIREGNFTLSGTGKALDGSLEAKVDVTKKREMNVNLIVEDAELSKIVLSKGKLVGKTSITVGISSKRGSRQVGKASVKMAKFVAKDFPFQNLPHIEWLLPAVKVLTLNEACAEISLTNKHLDILKFTGNGNGIRTDLAGRLDYNGSMNADMTLYLAKNMATEIPYLTSKALPRNNEGEYVVPVFLKGPFPELEVEVRVDFVTRAVGGVLKDVFKSIF